jgi:tetratricopeptide (TPR) repeat protein
VEQLARMSRLLEAVVDADAAGRRAWLEALPEEHRDLEPALRRALLSPAGQALAALPPLAVPADAATASRHAPGDLVGPYRLVRELGSGGMAEVWLAQRADGAFRRDVALKMPSRTEEREELARRFAVERDILAALEHPHIARFYDAGLAEDGTSYLALEYVAGTTLLRWADERGLGTRARIELFLQVLAAVQYAHDRGVLHRDLKPSNVLVTEPGGVRLLDFGVGRLMERPAEADLTRLYGRALTPGYASPEQLAGSSLGPASDVWSLGVVLHELLTGRRPHADDAAERSAHVLRGDLAAIVRKALAPSPAGRYAGAAAFAADLRRYLADEPVDAVPPSLAYRAGKLVRRHRAGAIQAAVVVVVVGLLGHQVMRRAPSPPQPPASAPAPQATDSRAEARMLVLQGDIYTNGPFERDTQRAEVAYKQAIALDPQAGLPWAKLAFLHLNLAERSPAVQAEHHALAARAIEAALRVEPDLLAAHAARFRYAVRVDHAWAQARAALDRMRAIDPVDMAWLPACEATYAAIMGRLDEAIRIQRLVVERDPANAPGLGALAFYALQEDRYEESWALLHAERELNPHAAGIHALMGVNLALLGRGADALTEIGAEPHEGYRLWAAALVHAMAGRRDEADAALAALKGQPQGNAYRIGQVHAMRGQKALAFEWLARGCAERDSGCESIRVDRFVRGVRDDARYKALLQKLKLNADPPPAGS